MTDITPSDTQARAIAAIKDWFKNRTKEQQVFRLFGYAGTGKIHRPEIRARRARARSAQEQPRRRRLRPGRRHRHLHRQGGAGASPQGHAGAHHPQPDLQRHRRDRRGDRGRRQEDRGGENEARATCAGFDRTAAEAAIEAMRQAMSQMKKPRFALNPQSDAAHARLIVLDEVSMVGEDMARDLMSFGKPILVLGDPGQLPPIKGEGAFTKDAPDVMLTEIHRQADESAIIRLATMARQGEPIGFGQYDTFVWKMRKMDVTPGAVPARRPGDLRAQCHAPPAQQRHAAGRRLRRWLATHTAPARRSSASRTRTISA